MGRKARGDRGADLHAFKPWRGRSLVLPGDHATDGSRGERARGSGTPLAPLRAAHRRNEVSMLPLLQTTSQVAEIRTMETQASPVGDAVSRGQQSRASADEDGSAPTPSPHGWDSAWGKNPFSFEFYAGIAIPLGAVGIMASYSFVPWVALACGAGTNFVGPQFACMARGRLILRQTRAVLWRRLVGRPARTNRDHSLGRVRAPSRTADANA